MPSPASPGKGGKPNRGTRADRRLTVNRDRAPRKQTEGHHQTDPGAAAARRTRARARSSQPRRGSK